MDISVSDELVIPEDYQSVVKNIEAARKANPPKIEIPKSIKKVAARDKRPNYIAVFDGLVDLVLDQGRPVFLVKEGGALELKEEVQINGKLYYPPPLEKILWTVPRASEVVKHYECYSRISEEQRNKEIYQELKEHHRNISELPSEAHYDLLASWVLHTYLMERFNYSPILCFYAVAERGKSRTGKGISYVAYRGVHLLSVREHEIFRLAQHSNASLFLDCMDIWKKTERAGSEDVILGRFERGAKITRILHPDRGAFNDTTIYYPFGPTIIATNVEPHKILGTRAVSINMPDSSKKFNNEVKEDLFLPLRERLTAFRALNLDKEFEVIDKPADGRLGDILKPLFLIIRWISPEREKDFHNLIKSIHQKKLILKAETIEGQILCVVRDLQDVVNKGRVAVSDITNRFNADKSERSKIDVRTIGRKLDSLGFDKLSTGKGTSAIYWDEDKINKLLDSYGLPKTQETQETPAKQGGG
ncbi:hypothetical protein ACFL52_00975 [Candidatus Margulisiibacteriota bacterium]